MPESLPTYESAIPAGLFWGIVAVFIAVRLWLSWLSWRGDARPEARDRALKYFSVETIEKGFRYHRAGTPVGLVQFALSQAVLLWFLVSGASVGLSEWALEVAGGRFWLQTGIYLFVVMAASGVASLPFDYYFGYVIEHRFGFSNLELKGWVKLQAKQAAIGVPLGLALGVGAYALLRRYPVAWVWALPLAFVMVQLVMTVLFPKLLLPLFFKVKPAEDPELIGEIEKVCERAGVQVKSIKMIDASRYSKHTNAFFTGFGRFKSIYLFDTLLKEHTPAEVAAILAHELGHWKHNHVMKGMALGVVSMIAGTVALFFAYPWFQQAEFVRVGPIYDPSGLALLALLGALGGFVAAPISSALSRRFERQADEACIELTGEREVYVRDFIKLAEENHANLLPHPLIVTLRYSHPPIVERIESVREAGPGAVRA